MWFKGASLSRRLMKEPSSLKQGLRQHFLLGIGTDIRAAHRASPLGRWRSIRVMSLLLSDALALGLAWQLARYLNQFYSPIPDQLVWWVWLGLPSLFWLFAGMTLLLFTHFGLYGATVRGKGLPAGSTAGELCLLYIAGASLFL